MTFQENESECLSDLLWVRGCSFILRKATYIVVGTPALFRTLNHSSLVMYPLLSLSAARKYFLNWNNINIKNYVIPLNILLISFWALLFDLLPPSKQVCTFFFFWANQLLTLVWKKRLESYTWLTKNWIADWKIKVGYR